jgi:hypothetical protein
LLEVRARVSGELARVEEVTDEDVTGAEAVRLLVEFLRTTRWLDEGARQSIIAELHKGPETRPGIVRQPE